MANALLIGGSADGNIIGIDLHPTGLPNRIIRIYEQPIRSMAEFMELTPGKLITIQEVEYKFSTKIDDLYIYECTQ